MAAPSTAELVVGLAVVLAVALGLAVAVALLIPVPAPAPLVVDLTQIEDVIAGAIRIARDAAR